METQKVVNLLNSSENGFSEFATKNGMLLNVKQRVTIHTIIQSKFLTSSIEPSLRDYSDAYVLVTGNISVVGADDNTKVVFKNCAPFRKCKTEINETLILECLCTT